MSDLRTAIAAALDKALPVSAGDVELGLQTHLAKRIINGKRDQWVRREMDR